MSGDIYYDETSLILNFKESFSDDSTFNQSLLNFGDTFIDSNGANYDGDGDYHKVSQLLYGTDDFTIECIVSRANSEDSMCLCSQRTVSSVTGRLIFLITSAGQLNIFLGGSPSLNLLSNSSINLNTETHCELTRTDNIFRLFINGNLQATSAVVTTPVQATDFYISRDPSNLNRDALGYIKAMRVTNSSRHTDSFTPLPAPFPISLAEIRGTIVESLAADKFIILAHSLDGALVGYDASLTNDYVSKINTFQPVYITVLAYQGDTRKNSTAYALNALMFPANPIAIPYYYKCIQAGTTASAEPILPTIPGNIVTDNTVIWQCIERLIQPITHGPLIPS